MILPSSFPRLLKKNIRFSPWALFVPFCVSNALLSYIPLPLSFKFWIGTLGILVPLLAGFWGASEERKTSRRVSRAGAIPFSPAPLGNSSPSVWLWVLFLLVLIWTHFDQLTSVPYWPIGDEGGFSMTALDLQRHWSWKLLLGPNQWEPLFAWMLSLFFRVVPPSLTALRLFPDLLSLFAVFCAYWAFRSIGNRWFAFACAWAMALNFWSFTYSRWCVREGLLLPWELMAFGLAVRVCRWDKPIFIWVALLAAVLGSGFYVFTSWPQVALLTAVAVLMQMKWSRREWKKTLFLGCGFLLAAVLAAPMVGARLADGGVSHIRDVFDPSSFLPQAARYAASLFWYGFQSAPWGPSWGGFFNPVLGALFFLGVLQWARRVSPLGPAFLFLTFFFFIAPVALTSSFSPYRVTALLPLCVFLIAAGLNALLEGLSPPKAQALFLLMWIPSLALDFHHYVGSYSQVAGTREYAKAYGILEDQWKKTGPLVFLDDFNTDYDDKTLEVVCYPFDAVRHSDPDSRPASWAALVADVHYAPYLTRRFPGLQWSALQTVPAPTLRPKPLGLFLIPTHQIPRPLLDRWQEVNGLYRDVDWAVKNKSRNELWASPLVSSDALSGLSKGDRFLTALYWEKAGFFKFLDGYFLQATDAYRRAIQEGVPAAHLYYDLGVCLQIQNKPAEAKENFAKAAALAEGKD